MGKGRNHLELLNCSFFCFSVKSWEAESTFGLGRQVGGAGLGQVGDDQRGHGGLTVAAGKGWSCLPRDSKPCLHFLEPTFSKALLVSPHWGPAPTSLSLSQPQSPLGPKV